MIRSNFHSPLFARMTVNTVNQACGKEGHTPQVSRIRQRDPAIDLSGPKALAESLTPRSNSTVVDVVELSFDFLPPTVPLGSRDSSGRTTSGPYSGRVGVSTLSEGTIRGSD